VYRNDLADPSATVVSQLVQTGVNDTALVIANVCRGATGASCSADIKIASRGTNVDVAGDIVGYFIKPQATALQCVDVYNAAPVTVGAGTDVCQNPPACTAGYTETSLLFDNVGFGGLVVSQFNGPSAAGTKMCGRNTGGATQSFTSGRRCCRVPGR
jgi:hypothetical protein